MNPKGIRIRPKVRESEVDIREQYNRLYEQYING